MLIRPSIRGIRGAVLFPEALLDSLKGLFVLDWRHRNAWFEYGFYLFLL